MSYGNYCCVVWCNNNGKTSKNAGVKFFRIPRDSRSQVWVRYAKRPELAGKSGDKLNKGYRVCSAHFSPDSFLDPQKSRLSKTAVPTARPQKGRARVTSEGSASSSGVPAASETSAPLVDSARDTPVVTTLDMTSESFTTSATIGDQEPPEEQCPTVSQLQDCSASCPGPAETSALPRLPAQKMTQRRADVIRRLQAKLSKYRKTIKRLKKQQEQMPRTASDALKMLRPFVTDDVYSLIATHVNSNAKGKGRRFPLWLKKFALHLNFHGPKAYRFLSTHITLPSQRSLRRWLSSVKMTPGIMPGVMQAIALKAKSLNRRDRVCTLIFDEIMLKKNLSYDAAQDIVHGFSDDGSERTSSIADRALVFVLSGMSRKWVQPLAYTVGHTSASPSVIRNTLLKLIEELKNAGYIVKAVVCDQGASNVSVAKHLGVTDEKPFFIANGEKIYFMFDVPHLIKTTRNNLQAHKLTIGTEIIDWSYIVQLYHSNHELRLRLAPKLTERHIFQKAFSNMKVKRATQVLSASVCVAIMALVYAQQLTDAAMPTAYFCERMDKIFDCLNSSKPKKTEQKLRYAIRKGNTEITEFLSKQIPWIAQWKFGGRRQPQTIKSWQITIKSVLMLWDDISTNYDFSFLMTRRLQQDPLENIFGTLRQMHGCNVNPNVQQFTTGLKHIIIKRLFKLSAAGNVEEDNNSFLQELSTFSLQDKSFADSVQRVDHDDFPSLEEISELASNIKSNLIDDSSAYYVAGYLIKMFLEKKPECCDCSALLKDESGNVTESHQYFLMLKAYHVPGRLFGNLVVPSERAFNYIQQLEHHFLAIIESVAHNRCVCAALFQILSDVTSFRFCSEPCAKRFLFMFCRVRLNWHVRFVNRNLDKVRFHASTDCRQLEKFKA